MLSQTINKRVLVIRCVSEVYLICLDTCYFFRCYLLIYIYLYMSIVTNDLFVLFNVFQITNGQRLFTLKTARRRF